MIRESTGPDEITLSAPAKVNLFLEIRGKRSDGYHEIDTIMHSVNLYDRLRLRLKKAGITFHGTGREMGPDPHNLAVQAAEMMLERLDSRIGLEIDLNKQIPVGAGLGGGSSDCAAVLFGFNHLLGNPLSEEELKALAGKLGSDVAFFLTCGTALCEGRGERVTTLPGIGTFHFLLLYPGFSVSTRKVYENLNLDLTKCKNRSSLISALERPEEIAVIDKNIFNRLEETVMSSDPALFAVREHLQENGFASMKVTGSGSSLFQIIEDDGITDAYQKLKELRQKTEQNQKWEVFLVTSTD